MSQGGPPPVSFKTNVNRMKTKRWVEAKHYNYDGDDWGDDDDEYDDYGDQQEPAPEPTKPTGLRPAGQTVPAQSSRAAANAPDPSRGVESQQQPVTSPPQPPFGRPPNERQHSFGRGDDRASWNRPGSGPPSGSHSPIVSPIRTAYGQQPAPTEQARSGTPTSMRSQPPAGSGAPRAPATADPQTRWDAASAPSAPQPPFAQQQRPSSSGSGSSNPASAANRERSDSGRTLPFIRPADIYKRMQEEKEKQRLSQESSRTDLDVAAREKPREPSPAKSAAASDSGRTRKAPPQPVVEQPSEPSAEPLPGPAKLTALDQGRRTSGSPRLPEIGGFGDDFGSDFGSSFMSTQSETAKAAPAMKEQAGHTKLEATQASLTPTPTAPAISGPMKPEAAKPAVAEAGLNPPSSVPTAQKDSSGGLQHAPSQGFRSAVHQAFDQPAVPDSPSTSGSQVARSNSETTSVISPIISRGPSDAHQPRAIDTDVKESQFPTITEEPSPAGSAKSRGRGISAADHSPSSFVPGYRRDANAPSPDNSPARRPAVGSTQGLLRSPQEGRLADEASAQTTVASPEKPSQTTTKDEMATSQPSSRAGSPSKGRIRDLAEKIESGPNSRRGSQDSGTGEKSAQRPQSGRLDNFRTSLPGGWNSYTTNPTPGGETSSAQANPSHTSADVTTKQQPELGSKVITRTEPPVEAAPVAPPSTKPTALPDRPNLAAPTGQEEPSSSIMHTPQGMGDGHDLSKDADYFSTVPPPLKTATATDKPAPGLVDTPAKHPNMSIESSPSDQESDRLRKQLVRELSPQHETAPPFDPRVKKVATDDSQLQSAGVPSEYERYWTSSSHQVSKPDPVMEEPRSQQGQKSEPMLAQPPTEAKTPLRDVPVQPQSLQRKFSWEASTEQLGEEVDDQDIVSPNTDFGGAFQSHQADHVAEGLYSPTAAHRLKGDEQDQAHRSPHGMDEPDEEDLNLLNSPNQPDFVARNDPLHPSAMPVAPRADGPVPRIQAFREVTALQSPEQRLKSYAQARVNLILQEEGLEDWLRTIEAPGTDTLPPPNPAFAQTRPSPSMPGVAGNAPVVGGGSVTNLGASPSSTKLSSQQMQSKGKDLLHSAGVFGGKANVAAKGLFAKGRNKLRNAGGDKASRKPSASNPETSRKPFKFGNFSTFSHSSTQRTTLDRSILEQSIISLSSPPQQHAPRNDEPLSPSVKNDSSPVTPVKPLNISKRHATVPIGYPPGTPPGPSPMDPTSPMGATSPMDASRPSVSSLGNVDPSKASSRPSSLSTRGNEASDLDLPGFATEPASSPLAQSHNITDPANQETESREAPAANDDIGEDLEADTPVDAPRASQHESDFITSEEVKPAIASEREASPVIAKSAVPEVKLGNSEEYASQVEAATPSKLPMDDNAPDSKGEETPTQEHFPPSKIPEIKPELVDSSEKGNHRSSTHIGQQLLIPGGGPISPSQRSSIALGEYESKRFILQTPAPDPDFTLMPILDFDNNGHLRQAEPIYVPVPKSVAESMTKTAFGSSNDQSMPSQSATNMLLPESAARSPEKQKMSVAVGDRPFSFIDFDKSTPKDLALGFQLSPQKEEPPEPDLHRRESLASVDEEEEDDRPKSTGILSDKDLEAAPPGTPLSARRPRSGVIEEPDIGDHPAFRNSSDRPHSYYGSSLRNEQPASPSQAGHSARTPRSASALGQISTTALQGPSSPQPSTRPTESLLSRPSGEVHLAPNAADNKKKNKRRSLLSSLSGQSDRSKRHSSQFDNSLPIDPSPNFFQPYKPSGFQQRKLSVDVEEAANRGPQRSLSRQLLQRLPGIPNSLGKSPEPAEMKPEKPEKGGRKRRLSGLTKFINQTVRPRQNSRSGPPPVDTFAHIRSTSQASYYDHGAQPQYQPDPAAFGPPASLHQRQQSYATQLSLGQNSQRSGSNSSLNRPNTSNSHRGPTYSPFPQQRSTSKANPAMLPPQANVIPSTEGSRTTTPNQSPHVRSRSKGWDHGSQERYGAMADKQKSGLLAAPSGHQRNFSAPEQDLTKERNKSDPNSPPRGDQGRKMRSGSQPLLNGKPTKDEADVSGHLRGAEQPLSEDYEVSSQGNGSVGPPPTEQRKRRSSGKEKRQGPKPPRDDSTLLEWYGMSQPQLGSKPANLHEQPRPVRTAYATDQEESPERAYGASTEKPRTQTETRHGPHSYTTTTTTTTTTSLLMPKTRPAAARNAAASDGKNRSTSTERHRTSSAVEDITQAFSLAAAYPGASPEISRYTPSPTAQLRLNGQDGTPRKKGSRRESSSKSTRESESGARSGSTQRHGSESGGRSGSHSRQDNEGPARSSSRLQDNDSSGPSGSKKRYENDPVIASSSKQRQPSEETARSRSKSRQDGEIVDRSTSQHLHEKQDSSRSQPGNGSVRRTKSKNKEEYGGPEQSGSSKNNFLPTTELRSTSRSKDSNPGPTSSEAKGSPARTSSKRAGSSGLSGPSSKPTQLDPGPSTRRDPSPSVSSAARDAKLAELPRIQTQQLPPSSASRKAAAAAAAAAAASKPTNTTATTAAAPAVTTSDSPPEPMQKSPEILAAEMHRTGSKAQAVKSIDVKRGPSTGTSGSRKAVRSGSTKTKPSSKSETSNSNATGPDRVDSKKGRGPKPAADTSVSNTASPLTSKSLSESTPTAQTPEERRAARRLAIEQSGITESEAHNGNGDQGTPVGESRNGKERDTERGAKVKSLGPEVDGEIIPMSSTAYPGQEWRPDFIAWEG